MSGYHFKRGFGSYVCDGDSIVTVIDGFTFTARLERDTDTDPHDYDGEGWCFDSAYEANRLILSAWDNDEWNYFTVVLEAQRDSVELGRLASLSGVEGNLGEDDDRNQHLTDVADGMLAEGLDAARARCAAIIKTLSAVSS